MGSGVREFAGYASRSQRRTSQQLGIIPKSASMVEKFFRNKELDVYDAYYEMRQYSGHPKWSETKDVEGVYIPIRKRQPKINFNFAKVLSSRVASKLVGRKNFPTWKIEDDPDTEDLLRLLLQNSSLRSKLVEPVRRCLNSGSVFVRFSVVNGTWKIEHFLSKWCYPEFDATGQLKKVEIKYIYEDKEDLDQHNNPKKKWFKMDLSTTTDILYDNPEYSSEQEEPEFKIVDQEDHNLGFVQGEWFVTADQKNEVDGPSIIGDILDFIDELNYSLSQSSDSISYNQDPQLTLKNMDEEEIDQLVRSSEKAWNLGREGEADLLEAGMNAEEAAKNFRESIKMGVQDIARVVLLDPEKMVAHAQSAKAMEVLHGPMVELIEELQPQMEKHIKNLMLKMVFTIFALNARVAPTPIIIPPGYKPKSLELVAMFPPIFPQTMDDLQKKVSIASSVSSSNLISRETMTRWLAKDFDVEDIEEELRKIETQPVINPFGAF